MKANIEIHNADVVKWLRGNQWAVQNGFYPKFTATFADPPYFLGSIPKRYGKESSAPTKKGEYARLSKGFMGQTWDGFKDIYHFQDWVTEWGGLMLDFVHPGGVLLMAGGTRTYHRLAAGLEDAGWEIADSLIWCYGSGFPKSKDIYAQNKDARWDGWGTALKPAYEPYVLARKPREGYTYGQCASEFGTAALNIYGGRIGDDLRSHPQSGWIRAGRTDEEILHGGNYERDSENNEVVGRWPSNFLLDEAAAAELDRQSGFSRSAKETVFHEKNTPGAGGTLNGGWNGGTRVYGYGDEGGASRFFYVAKATTRERELGFASEKRQNEHPTVKPIKLCQYLSTLLLPPAVEGQIRRLLVPFSGSGSEIIGAGLAGWDEIVGIEQSAKYIDIAKRRIAYWSDYDAYEDAMEENQMRRLF
jgi:DNA modification methylase